MSTNTDWKKLGRIFAAKRNSLNISQQKASDKLGVTRASIANFERGNQKFPIERLSELCDLYGLSLEIFLCEGLPCYAFALINSQTHMPIMVAQHREELIKTAIDNQIISSADDVEAKGYYISAILWSTPAQDQAALAQAS